MKKLDYLIIVFVLVFACILFFVFYIPYMLNTNNKIQLIINNQIIEEFDISENIIYEINTINEEIVIYKNNTLLKTIKYNNKNIYNKIEVINGQIKVIQSNCKNKDCMYMKINKSHKLPIICTNGITIKYKTNTYNNQSDIII